MLKDSDIAKLCYGRVIKSEFYNSSHTDAAGPHYAVILDADEEIRVRDDYYVAVISHNDDIDKEYLVPVPGRSGLTGFIVCSWVTLAHLNKITRVSVKLDPVTMMKVREQIRKRQEDLTKDPTKRRQSP